MKGPIRALAITGMLTASWMPAIISGSDIRATPPSRRMSAGTRSSAITAAAPASSATLACSGVTTSMITPPLSISARPVLTRNVDSSRMIASLSGDRAPPGAAQRELALNWIVPGPQLDLNVPVTFCENVIDPAADLRPVKCPLTATVVVVVCPDTVYLDLAPVTEKRPDPDTLTAPTWMIEEPV